MADEHSEREDKYDVGPSFVLPGLAAAVPVGGRVDTARHQLRNVYFDTDTHDLRRNRMTLRRRSGSTDTGWQLKLPGATRTEVSVPLTNGNTVPAELASLLHGVARGRSLSQIARLETERAVHRIVDAAGDLVAEVADDSVYATAIGSSAYSIDASEARVTQWREIEVEAGPSGSEEALGAIGALLTAAGAVRSARVSKLDLALGSSSIAPAPVTPSSALGDAVTAYLQTQIEAIVAGDLALRRHRDVVHPTRVAIRRLRSTLRTFADVVDASAADLLEADLVWLAGLLGGVRDADVLRVRLHELVDQLPPEYVLGPVLARIDGDLLAERSEHDRTMREGLDSARMLSLLDRLEQWRLAPPLTARAEQPGRAAKVYLREARRKLDKRLDRAVTLHARLGQLAQAAAASLAHAQLDHEENELVHSARKAGKRFRYAAELCTPLLGEKARGQARTGEHLQDLLGEHQDIVVSAAALRRLGAMAGSTPGENGFTFGLLLGRELARGDDIRAELAATKR